MEFTCQPMIGHPKWDKAISLMNGIMEIEIPLVVGPRVTSLRLNGGENIFYESLGAQDYIDTDKWFLYGGHRLMHAPEAPPRSCYPDNQPVEFIQSEDRLSIIQEVEKTTGIQKSIHIQLETSGNNVVIDHQLDNRGVWPVELAGWAVTMLAAGGRAVIPLPENIPFPQALLPNCSVALWPYTSLADRRFRFLERFLTIDQQPGEERPLKLGVNCRQNWAGYFWREFLFIKKFIFEENSSYPDLGSNLEVFTDGSMLELETLSPLQVVQPGECLRHREEWQLWRTNGFPQSEREMIRSIEKFI